MWKKAGTRARASGHTPESSDKHSAAAIIKTLQEVNVDIPEMNRKEVSTEK